MTTQVGKGKSVECRVTINKTKEESMGAGHFSGCVLGIPHVTPPGLAQVLAPPFDAERRDVSAYDTKLSAGSMAACCSEWLVGSEKESAVADRNIGSLCHFGSRDEF